MTIYNTGNPTPSVDARDLNDNMIHMEEFALSELDYGPDRFGVNRLTMQGIRNASQYVDLGPYAAGLVFTSRNQVFSYNPGAGAEFYSPGPAITLPYTTTGAGAGEIANFRSVGDAMLRADLAASSGSSLVGFLQYGTDAEERTTQDKLRENISVLDFMTPAQLADSLLPVPLLDHGPAFIAAIDAAAGSGPVRGTRVLVPGGRNYRCSSFTVRNGIELAGERRAIPDFYDTQQGVTASAIQLIPGSTITLGVGNSLTGLTIFPAGLSGRQNAAAVASWAGTAITVPGDGCSISDCVIYGFNYGIDATSHSRLRLTDVLMDCKNGVRQSGSYDISYYTRVHCWPYTSQGAGLVPADNIRPGTGIELFDIGDWTKLTDCFTYGYERGIRMYRVSGCTLVSCGTDNVPGLAPTSRGISVEGVAQGGEIRIIAPQCAANGTGIYIDVTGGFPTTGNVFILQADIWACVNNAIVLNSGSGLFVTGGHIRDTPQGIVINNGSAFGRIAGVRFANDVDGDCIQYAVSNDNFRISECVLQSGGTGRLETVGKTASSVASAAALVISQWTDYQVVSGSTTITSILSTNSNVGREVTLRSSSGVTFTHSANLVLKGAVNAVLSAGNSLTLVYGGNNIWREEGRNF